MHAAPPASPSAILFDLDGTLTDRPATVAAFANAFVAHFEDALRFRGEPEDAAAGVATAIAAADGNGHRPRAELLAHLRQALPWTRPPGAGQLEAFWSDAFPAATRPADGLVSVFDELRRRGFRLGVVTNGGTRSQQRKLDAIGGRDRLIAVVVSGAVGARKPDPRIFRLALSAMGASADQCWFVGDHPEADVLGARAAGLTAVWRRGLHPWPSGRPAADHVIDRLADLLPLLDGTPGRRPATG